MKAMVCLAFKDEKRDGGIFIFKKNTDQREKNT